jgi:hypothetical protein
MTITQVSDMIILDVDVNINLFRPVFDAISFSQISGEPLLFGFFWEQFVSWFSIKLELDWPAGN